MPTVVVDRDVLFEKLGKSYENDLEGFEDLCFQFGLEYDGMEIDESKNVKYRIEVAANRYDLLCVEGIARALKHFLSNHQNPPTISYLPEKPNHSVFVTPNVAGVRPHIVAAILRNVKFTPKSYQSFIDMQDKLCFNLGRRRRIAAMGTSDMKNLQGPFKFDAWKPEDISFVPLTKTEPIQGTELVATFEGSYLKPYVQLIKNVSLYPVWLDSRNEIISVPPVVNSETHKITMETRDVLIDVTGTDLTKLHWILNTFVSIFSEYCEDNPFTVEPLEVIYSENHPMPPCSLPFASETSRQTRSLSCITPNLETFDITCSVEYLKKISGISHVSEVNVDKIISHYLPRMLLNATKVDDDLINVKVPCYRNDVLGPCDVAEDLAIAYGFNLIQATEMSSVGMLALSGLTEQLETLISQCGYKQCLGWGLCSFEENFDNLRRPYKDIDSLISNAPQSEFYKPIAFPIEVSEPKTAEFQIARTTLLSGILKTMKSNQASALPLKLFEIGDCGVRDESDLTYCRFRRHLCIAYADSNGSGLEYVHGMLDVVLQHLQLTPNYAEIAKLEKSSVRTSVKRFYRLKEIKDGPFFDGRCVQIEVYDDKDDQSHIIGVMGTLHPDVLNIMGLPFPMSAFEISLEPFRHWLEQTDLFDC